MKDIEKYFRENPQAFSSQRNTAKTIVFTTIGAALVAIAAGIILNYPAFSQWAEPSGPSGSRYNSAVGLALGTPLFPVLIILIGALFLYSAFKARDWSRVETGAAIKPLVRDYFRARTPAVAELAQNFTSGPPSSFLPLPDPDSKGGAHLEIWLCEQDEIGYVFLGHRIAKVSHPIIEMQGERYQMLVAAKKRGLRRPVPNG